MGEEDEGRGFGERRVRGGDLGEEDEGRDLGEEDEGRRFGRGGGRDLGGGG